MYVEVLYHGTEIARGKEMLKQQKMVSSRGDKHWLGDGSYFYEDDFYAYKWIKDMYKGRFKKDPNTPNSLFDKYGILEGEVRTPKNRIFDLDRPRNKIEFDKIYENCKIKQQYLQRFSDTELADGVVLNIMFNDMWYLDEYDIVIATFKRRSKKYVGNSIRLNHISEKQICVKNPQVVTPLSFCDCSHKVDEFQNLINSLYNAENPKNDNESLIYNARMTRKGF
ncbi:MAG: hypothetical protein WCZ27_02625 [Tissierellaceae bacterium]